ncbi:MAG TPA: DUF1302 family protein [Terriglobales bacterium]|nr:DUF1302 family protein [Terriglobales bacterium]
MARSGLRVWGFVCFVVVCAAPLVNSATAANLDKNGEIKLGVRTYVNARIGTENTDYWSNTGIADPGPNTTNGVLQKSRTFPYSPAGHLRQNRFFAEVEFKHDLARLQKENWGPLSLLNSVPSWMRIRNLSYGLTYRGEGDGIYDWGPSEYRTARQWGSEVGPLGDNCGDFNVKGCLSGNPATGRPVPVGPLRKRLRDLGTHRSRLFQAYFDADIGRYIWFRFGRQIVSWGETDSFRLLDNINPVDSSFGGFLISLDERRVPLDMLRMQFRTGDIGPLTETFLELYAAIDNKVGYAPGIPSGGPWSFPNTGVPSGNTVSQRERPARSFSDMRGGGRFNFNLGEGTFSLAHYYTYFDTPTVQSFVKPGFPVNPRFPSTDPDVNAWHDSVHDGYSVLAVQKAPLTQVTGASMTFAMPSLYSILRGEFAYFHNEARFTQSQLDPFIYHYFREVDGEFLPISGGDLQAACNEVAAEAKGGPAASEQARRNCRLTGGRRMGDSINMAIGWDANQFIRFLNPHQTFFISTQFFYKRLLGAVSRRPIASNRIPYEGEVLPVTEFDTFVPQGGLNTLGAVEPSLIAQPTNSYFNTFFITTAYRSGTINPSFTFFYDWGGATVFIPAITFTQDPFRLSIDYSILAAGRFKGGSGTSLLKDRDNIQFRLEYVI